MATASACFARGARALIAAAATVAVAGCASSGSSSRGMAAAATPSDDVRCGNSVGFAVSLVSDTGGEPTPAAAATWFVEHGGIASLPEQGWHVVSHSGDGVTLRAGASSLHTVQGSDETWQVDSGTRCIG